MRIGLEDWRIVAHVLRALNLSQWVNHVGSAFFSTKNLRGETLYDLVMVVEGKVSMEVGVWEDWSLHNCIQSDNANAIMDRVTANFINELKSIYLREMIDCFEVTDRRTLMHMRRINRYGFDRPCEQVK